MIYRAVMKPAFPAVVMEMPTCCSVSAAPRTRPHQAPPMRVMRSGFSCWRIGGYVPSALLSVKSRMTGMRTMMAMTSRAALKVKGPI